MTGPVRRFSLARIAFAALAAAAVAGAFAVRPAAADDDRQRLAAVPLLPAYRDECGACHLAYPPGLLPADAWHRQMDSLAKHYGSDASLDEATHRTIAGWLAAHAGDARGRRAAPPEDRITRTAWFLDEHDEVPAGTWSRPSVKSPAQCNACHRQADQGDFDEHAVRIPR
jgi:hypothetical protein